LSSGRAQRARAARHQVPAEQPQGSRDRSRAVRFDEHDQDASAPRLRQARRAQSRAKRSTAPGSSGSSHHRAGAI